MRILLYSDLQLHPYKEFAENINGVNSRLLDHMAVLDQIYEYAETNDIQTIVFAGDMFEARTRVDVVAAKLLAEWKYKVAQLGITQIDIIGNHDLVDKSTTNNAIELYRHIPQQEIVSEPRWRVFQNSWQAILCIPYRHRIEDIKAAFELPCPKNIPKENCIAVIHYGLYDVLTESNSMIRDLGYETEGQIRLSDLEPLLQKVKHVFFGHYHITTSVTDRVHFIGTPLQHKFGERRVDTRFLDIDLDSGTFKSVPTKAPRFYEFNNMAELKVNELSVANNFVRVNVEAFEDREPMKERILALGAKGVQVSVVKKKAEVESRLGLNLGMSFEEMGSIMVDSDYETNLDKSKLKTVLMDVLKTATARMNN